MIFGPFLLIAIFSGVIPLHACIITSKQISDASGLDFEIRDEDCDAFLYKGESMAVLVSSRVGPRDQVTVFKFTPVWWVPPPDIKVDKEHSTILISVAAIGSIYFRVGRWSDMRIEYDIWKADEARFIDLARRCGARGC